MAPQTDQTGQISAELERLLASREFANSERMARFLRHVVERTLAGDRDGLKEPVIGMEVFDREPSYNPKIDPVVRNEARRLRAKLEAHYSQHPAQGVRISIPKGGYVAEFEAVAAATATVIEPVGEPAPSVPAPVIRTRRLPFALLAGALILAAAVWFARQRPREHGLPVLSTVTSYAGRQSFPCPSPDGSEVAFVWAGEGGGRTKIYIAKVSGGEARRLTRGPMEESFPAWSPDGTRIAFTRGEKVVIARVSGGEEHELTAAFGSAPIAWSPDGKSLVFSDWTIAKTTIGLLSADALTGARRQLTSASTFLDASPAFSPDGSEVAFTRCGMGSCDVFMIGPSGGEPRQITHQRTGLSGLTWSPDGATIVVAANRIGPYQLWQIAASGSADPQLIPVAGEDVRFPRFNTRAGAPPRLMYEQALSDSNIWRQPLVMTPNGPTAFRGEASRVISSTRLDNSPRISPDGRKIAFVSNRSGFDEIWTVGIDGSNLAPVTQMRPNSLGSPRWSPDSSRIIFDAVSNAGRALFIVDATGGTARRWSAYGTTGRASWSQDGLWIYYYERNAQAVYEIWKVSSTDPTHRQLAVSDGMDAFESEDGATLFFNRNRDLWQMPVGGPASRAALVPTGIPVAGGWWVLAAGGIYFVDMYAPQSQKNIVRPLYFYDLRTRARRFIGNINADLSGVLPDLAVTPDGAFVYYSAMDIAVSQIRMIEGGF